MSYQIVPAVDAVREFLEIAGDFTNPLEVVREAISNSVDAGANRIDISFTRPKEAGKSVLVIEIRDDGHGMNAKRLQSFFDLGNSDKRDDGSKIGEKGHGTKVFFNCSSIRVETVHEGQRLVATMEYPFERLHDGQLPVASVDTEEAPSTPNGTRILIKGFNGGNGEPFTQHRLHDYILWFTKFGSWESAVGITTHQHRVLYLNGLDETEAKEIKFGHFFPENSLPVQRLFDTYVVRAPDYYCKRVVRLGNLRRFPEIKFDAVFSIEGNKVKQAYNPMLRRQGYAAPAGAYTVQDRYGLWLCKDFIPVERKNNWIGTKGSEFTKFHAFVNCQTLSLTANRGSISNTETMILEDLKEAIEKIYDEIVSSDDWRHIDWLEEQAGAYVTSEKEAKDFKWRQERAQKSNIAILDGTTLVEPTRESGVYAMLVQLSILRPNLFPFEIVDYDTHSGIDVIAKMRDPVPVAASILQYVELKYFLGSSMNHSFDNMRAIVCWDTAVKHGEATTDLAGNERVLHIAPADPSAGGYTGYFLRRDFKPEIQVFVLKDYLREKLGIEFRPRNVVQAAAIAAIS